MKSKELFISILIIILCLIGLSAYQIYKAYLYSDNYQELARTDLSLRFERILSKENTQMEFYNEMEQFLKDNPAYKALFFLNDISDEANDKKIVWSIPWRVEGMELSDNYMNEIVKVMGGGQYKGIELASLSFTAKQLKSARTLLPDMSLHQVIKGKVAIRDSYYFYKEAKIVFLFSLAFYWLLITIFIYIDAKKKKRHAFIWALFTLITNLVAVLVYYLFNPKKINKCPQCAAKIYKKYNICPYCGEKLKIVCSKCRHEIGHSWSFCPECGDRVSDVV